MFRGDRDEAVGEAVTDIGGVLVGGNVLEGAELLNHTLHGVTCCVVLGGGKEHELEICFREL